MNLKLCRLVIVSTLLSLGACVVYEPVPVSSQPTLQQHFDRSWAAAAGAMSDQGLTITSQDRGSGLIQGERGGTTITAALQTLADGRIQVTFNSKGADSKPPGSSNGYPIVMIDAWAGDVLSECWCCSLPVTIRKRR